MCIPDAVGQPGLDCLAPLQADCLEEHEVLARKAEMARLVAAGLDVYAFPPNVVRGTYDAAYGLSGSQSGVLAGEGAEADGAAPFQLPFNVVAGNEADTAVHPFWFVRKYRCAPRSLARPRRRALKVMSWLQLLPTQAVAAG
jgi:hypothetical protein